MNKKDVAQLLKSIGTLLEIKGENQFKVNAYYNGAKTVENLNEDITILVREDRLKDMKGIGKALTQKISEFVNTGKLRYYEGLLEETPREVLEFLKIPGLGPKKVRELYYTLGITTLGELEYACMENRLLNHKGFGRKTQDKISEGIRVVKRYAGKLLYCEANEVAHRVLAVLDKLEMVNDSCISGELRRKCETVAAIDIVLLTSNKTALRSAVEKAGVLNEVYNTSEEIIAGKTSFEIDLNIYPAYTHEFKRTIFMTTGSREHAEAIVKLIGNNNLGNISSEEDIYKFCGMDYIEPELREGRREIEAALSGKLPYLITNRDIMGVFHVHTSYSDGANTIEEMASVAKAMGYSYLGIGDHSKSSFYARGLSESEVRKQMYEISQINDRDMGIKILKGIECDILEDGSLDYDDSILEAFDYVIASVHSRFNMSRERMTERIKRAISNKYVTMLGHLTGRLLLNREPYSLNIDEILSTAASYGKIIEINANPYRLDLDWRYIKEAKDMGIKFSINPDAHNVHGIYDTVYGVNIARKGWLEKKDLINTMGFDDIRNFLSNK